MRPFVSLLEGDAGSPPCFHHHTPPLQLTNLTHRSIATTSQSAEQMWMSLWRGISPGLERFIFIGERSAGTLCELQ
jgi:hypothetical protein